MYCYRYVLGFSLAVLYGLVSYAPAVAQETVRCESEQFNFKRCPVDTGGEVRIVRQLSDTPCRRGETWGYDGRGIWVDEGCAAEFRVTSRRAWGDYNYYGYDRDYNDGYGRYDRGRGYYGYGRSGRYGKDYDRGKDYYGYGYGRDYPRSAPGRTVRCESEQFNFKRCPVDTGGEVQLVRQLSDSSCRRGETWGYDGRGIWVDEGCAAEFRISRR